MNSDPSQNPGYSIRLSKEAFLFSAAHFITYDGERLHGHNYRVRAELYGPLDENSYVLDFVAMRDSIAAITAELDHRVVLPTEHPMIQVEETPDGEVVARFKNRRWVFPRDDCKLLPVANTTAELLAQWIGQRLLESLGDENRPASMLIEVEESDGQSGVCRL